MRNVIYLEKAVHFVDLKKPFCIFNQVHKSGFPRVSKIQRSWKSMLSGSPIIKSKNISPKGSRIIRRSFWPYLFHKYTIQMAQTCKTCFIMRAFFLLDFLANFVKFVRNSACVWGFVSAASVCYFRLPGCAWTPTVWRLLQEFPRAPPGLFGQK